MELVPLRYLQKQKSRFFTVCSAAAGPSPSSWPKLKFPVESVIIGRIQKFDTFFNSARKVRKNGIGPIKIREKKLLRDFRVALIVFLFSPQMAYKIQCGGDKNASTHFWDWNFFWDILMGPIPFFLTFRAELKKISKKIIRPKMTDSTGNFGFVHKGGEGQQQHTHSKKIEIFQIANRPQWPIPSSVPHWPWLKKMYFRALARALRALRAHRPPNYRSSTIPNVRVCGSSRTELDYFRNEESSVG